MCHVSYVKKVRMVKVYKPANAVLSTLAVQTRTVFALLPCLDWFVGRLELNRG